LRLTRSHTSAGLIQNPKIIRSLRTSAFCSLEIPFESFDRIGPDSFAVVVAERDDELGVHLASLRGFQCERESLPGILRHSSTMEITLAQPKHRRFIRVLDRPPQPDNRRFVTPPNSSTL